MWGMVVNSHWAINTGRQLYWLAMLPQAACGLTGSHYDAHRLRHVFPCGADECCDFTIVTGKHDCVSKQLVVFLAKQMLCNANPCRCNCVGERYLSSMRGYNALASQQVGSHIEEEAKSTCMWSCCAKHDLVVTRLVLRSGVKKAAYCSLSGWRTGHSWLVCNSWSLATAMPPQCLRTQSVFATCWSPENQPATIGRLWEPSLKYKQCCICLPETGSWQYRLRLLKGLIHSR